MERIRMVVIAAHTIGERAILQGSFIRPALEGTGPLTYDCGKCGVELMKNVTYKEVEHVVVTCYECHWHNAPPRLPAPSIGRIAHGN